MRIFLPGRLAARAGVASCILLSVVRAAPVLVGESYTVTEDTPLVVGAPGLLANDSADPPGSALLPFAGTPPAHGTVTINSDGSFRYTPAAEYSGPDSFTYIVPGARTFTIDQPRSIVTIDATTTVSLGARSASDTGRVSGNIQIMLNPATSPFQLVQVQDFSVTLAERVDLNFCWFSLFGSCLTGLNTHIDANGLNIDQVRPGPAVTATSNGTFSQPGNTIGVVGTVYLQGIGLDGVVTVPPTAELNQSDIAYDLSNARVYMNAAGRIELKMPLDVTQQLVDPGGQYTVDLHVTGDIYATAPVTPLPPVSSATVNVNVTSVDDAPVAVADRYYTRQNQPLQIPATAVVTSQTLLPSGSVWKYLTGTNAGTAWRNPAYDDSGWAAGSGILGYGDADILPSGTIPARANMGADASDPANPNYPAALFRTSFTLTNLQDTVQPQISIQRDDACIVYLNGVEIYRDSTPYVTGGPLPLPASGEVPWSTYAGASIPGADELVYKNIDFPGALLREGRNVVAVAVHQASATSSDLRFDMRVTRTRGAGGVLANDSDVDGPAMSATLLSGSTADVILNEDGSFSYTPPAGFTGTTAFTYVHRPEGNLSVQDAVLLPADAEWRYLDNGTTAPQNAGITAADWRSYNFDDSAWKAGAGEFGYGDGDETTVVEDDATAGSPTASERQAPSKVEVRVCASGVKIFRNCMGRLWTSRKRKRPFARH